MGTHGYISDKNPEICLIDIFQGITFPAADVLRKMMKVAALWRTPRAVKTSAAGNDYCMNNYNYLYTRCHERSDKSPQGCRLICCTCGGEWGEEEGCTVLPELKSHDVQDVHE